MAPHTVVVDLGSRNVTMVTGFIQAPNRRGTLDIMWTCLFTIFLCSWSVLCLNLPAATEHRLHRFRRKCYWFFLTIIGPEVIFQLALGEWLLARKWWRAMRTLGYEEWSMTHSFYANMGGYHLKTTDEGTFPLNAARLHFLLKEKYVSLPDLSRKQIMDRNKAEAVVRLLTVGQLCWFLTNCIGRGVSNLALTSLELSTLAFISSAIGTFLCWFHKPMDIETPTIIHMEVPVRLVQENAGKKNDKWNGTPLDFVDRKREWPWQLYWKYGLAIWGTYTKMPSILVRQRQRPIDRIPDDHWYEPTLRSLPILFLFHTAYAAILMAGWNLELPSYTELLLWRISSSIQLGTIILTWLSMPLQIRSVPQKTQKIKSWSSSTFSSTLRVQSLRMNSGFSQHHQHRLSKLQPFSHHSDELTNTTTVPNSPTSPSFPSTTTATRRPDPHPQQPPSATPPRRFFPFNSLIVTSTHGSNSSNPYKPHTIRNWVHAQAEKVRTLIDPEDPLWRVSIRLLIVYHGCFLIYGLARFYIIVEDVVSLRALPESAYQTVNWPVWFPQIS